MRRITVEKPTASVGVLAVEHDLGGWSGGTFAPRKSLFAKQWADARLYLYQRGVVVAGPDGTESAHAWRTARVLQYRVQVDGALVEARYTLIAPDGTAIAMGPGSHSLTKRHLGELGITELTAGAPFLHPGAWGGAIQRGITRAQLPEVLVKVQRGEPVVFGRVIVDRKGLTHKGKVALWRDIADFGLSNGTVYFNDSRARQLFPPEAVHLIPNLDLFLNLCHRQCHAEASRTS
ncbi:DUF6585 family protein [Allokutzneria sp. NRRL B-24872]|uniref:DUF6585 family protein n=1 Tax=Allokutzneria sp. NRRL B-24872 TaxID=1137961 RepID=UPI000A38C741|nr:DUF6585 family protein [Allokutzneria sp. NRRL B-24872]